MSEKIAEQVRQNSLSERLFLKSLLSVVSTGSSLLTAEKDLISALIGYVHTVSIH